MRALEFKSKIKDNHILIPAKVRSKLRFKQDKDVRVIVLVDDSDVYDDLVFQQAAQSQLLNEYADADSLYDAYNLGEIDYSTKEKAERTSQN